MGENSGIEWTHHTFNPWIGCTKVSPGCDHCYAETYANRYGKDVWGPGKPRQRTSPGNWNKPLKWNKEAASTGQRFRVFCASLADVFDNEVPQEWRTDLFALIRSTPDLDWLLLTKRIGNAAKMLPKEWGDGWPNVWLGSSIVNQQEADRDIPKLLAIPARTRFLSMEPLLGPVNLRPLRLRENDEPVSVYPLEGVYQIPGSHYSRGCPRIHWVIVGGESGSDARPMNRVWATSLRDQCKGSDTPFHFKQWGEWSPAPEIIEVAGSLFHQFPDGTWMQHRGKKKSGRLLDGRTHDGYPHTPSRDS